MAAAGATTKANPKEWGDSWSRCFLFQFRSAPVTVSPFTVAVSLSVCMSSFVWGSSGDHVGGKSEEAPGAWDEVSAVSTPPRRPAHPQCGRVGPSVPVGTPASVVACPRAPRNLAPSRENLSWRNMATSNLLKVRPSVQLGFYSMTAGFSSSGKARFRFGGELWEYSKVVYWKGSWGGSHQEPERGSLALGSRGFGCPSRRLTGVWKARLRDGG